jgi:hypothetical protein
VAWSGDPPTTGDQATTGDHAKTAADDGDLTRQGADSISTREESEASVAHC